MTDLKKVADAFSAHMCGKFGASVHAKEDAFEMKAVAWGMDLGREFGVSGLASSADFMTNFTTTIGTNVYMPKSHRENPAVFIEVFTHECQHVTQFEESGIEFSWLYLAEAEARVRYEADAYAAGTAVIQWMTGEAVSLDSMSNIVKSLVESYHLRQADAELAEDMFRSHLASLKNGIVMSVAAREAIAFLNANFPEVRGTL